MHKALVASTLLCSSLVLGLGNAARAQRPNAPDAIFLNGKVFSSDAKNSIHQAFAVRGDQFVATGTDSEIRRLAGPKTRIIDLKGRFVSPGLTDAHFHSEGGGPGVDLSKVRTMPELLQQIAKAAAATTPGELIVGNRDWHEMQLKEQRLPLATELDVVAPSNPVVLRRGGHSLILNTAALKRYNITKDTVSPPGGQVSKDADGELTGELFDNAQALAPLPAPTVGEKEVLRTQQAINSYGITSVRVIGSYKGLATAPYDIMRRLADSGKLTARYNMFLRYADRGGSKTADDYIAGLEAQNLKQGQGDKWVRVGGIKLIVDGGFEGGHYFEPYREPYGQGGTYRGVIVTPPAMYNELVDKLNAKGWNIATHAVGDAAVEQVLEAYEETNSRKSIAGQRWAIEHAFITRPGQLGRIKKLGIFLSVQDHLLLAGPAFTKYLGEPRASDITPLKTYLDNDLKVALGTDSDVIPINPYWELHHYIVRNTFSDGIYGADEAVTDRAKLLRLITAGYAELTGEEELKGKVAPGQLADFVIMSDDFLTVPIEKMPAMRALATYVGGQEVYRDPMWR
jgi:predicted amidohydrolase YtcJ